MIYTSCLMEDDRGPYEKRTVQFTRLIKEKGFSIRQISEMTELANSTISSYFHKAVNEGLLRQFEILISVDKKIRKRIESCIADNRTTNYFKLKDALNIENNLDDLELELYLDFRDSRADPGDMYEDIRFIETKIHSSVKDFLITKFGETEKEWWRKGIPKSVRMELSNKYEADDKPAEHKYCYTNLIHLDKIIQHNWKELISFLPKNVKADRKKLSKNLNRLNSIRNYVMHPVKGVYPTEEDFIFVKELIKYLELDKWP